MLDAKKLEPFLGQVAPAQPFPHYPRVEGWCCADVSGYSSTGKWVGRPEWIELNGVFYLFCPKHFDMLLRTLTLPPILALDLTPPPG